MKKITSLLLAAIFLASFLSKAQNVTITPSGITPALSGTYPRLSYDVITALPSPQEGDIAYDLTFSCLRVYNGEDWVCTQPTVPTPSVVALITAGGTTNDEGNSIAVDGSGNVYITGYFQGTTNFGGVTKTSTGFYDIFVAKYSNSGSLLWVQAAGGSDYDSSNGIAIDVSGNVYITGHFQGVATFGTTTKTSAGDVDIFLAKYNNSGVLQWVQIAGGTGSDLGNNLALDTSGNVYLTGNFYGTADFSGTAKTSAGGTDIFIAKYKSSGILEWVQTVEGTLDDSSIGIAVDANGKVLITGNFLGSIKFGASPIPSTGSADIFVAKYDPVVSNWTWVKTIGGSGYDVSRDIAVDASGNVYATGFFGGNINFGGGPITTAGSLDIFVVKFNSSGNFQWAQTAGGTNVDSGNGIVVDASNNVFILGNFSDTSNFGGISKTSNGHNDMFIAKYNSSGIIQWVHTMGGTSYDVGYGIALGSNKGIYVTGSFRDTVKFGSKSKTSAGQEDIFIARIQE